VEKERLFRLPNGEIVAVELLLDKMPEVQPKELAFLAKFAPGTPYAKEQEWVISQDEITTDGPFVVVLRKAIKDWGYRSSSPQEALLERAVVALEEITAIVRRKFAVEAK